MKTGTNPRRTFELLDERNKRTSSRNKCRCGGHSFNVSDLKDSSARLLCDANGIILDEKGLKILKRKDKIKKQLQIRKARKQNKKSEVSNK